MPRRWVFGTRKERLEAAVESTLRSKGFQGDLGVICETGNHDYAVMHVNNLKYLHQLAPDWAALTYNYWKYRNRDAIADFCMVQPKKAGMRTYYLPRGVMTVFWEHSRSLLEQNWQRDVEDVQRLQPDGLWWFGSGAVGEGVHVSESVLQKMGFASGVEARRRLLQIARPLLA